MAMTPSARLKQHNTYDIQEYLHMSKIIMIHDMNLGELVQSLINVLCGAIEVSGSWSYCSKKVGIVDKQTFVMKFYIYCKGTINNCKNITQKLWTT